MIRCWFGHKYTKTLHKEHSMDEMIMRAWRYECDRCGDERMAYALSPKKAAT